MRGFWPSRFSSLLGDGGDEGFGGEGQARGGVGFAVGTFVFGHVEAVWWWLRMRASRAQRAVLSAGGMGSLEAKHAKKKAAKGHNAYRPKKSRPSDKNRKPIVYELDSLVKPEEYTVKGN
ncbi:hypothetical protein TL16_g00815 [Triparma laevis f. inornata]|uniref:Uncharacterized protein n=2 Tax=Triparma laevis TaxID=1534972 RepID=A0A9W7KRR3_9STRA|nr:hypothetical protein TL16_g00815 [Triparma laevis f. inornata]GMI09289.1 hypothetical protein TrLO_g2053 [Triparma laevis f. longispina]